jgi:putative ABC transport system permease protein
MLIFKTAFFNLWRRKSRSLTVMVMVAFGVAALMLTQGLYEGMMYQMLEDTVLTGTGHSIIAKKGYYKSQLLSDTISESSKVHELIENHKNVAGHTTRLKCDGMVASAKVSKGVKIMGILPEREAFFMNYKNPMQLGEFKLDPNKRHVIIGSELADKLKVTLKKKVVISAQSAQKELVSGVFRVVGIIRTNNPEIDAQAVILHQDKMQKMFGLDGKISEYNIVLKDETILEATAQELQSGMADDALELLTWKKTYPLMEMMSAMFMAFIYISYVIVFMAVGVGVFNTLLISVMERVREFGILMAIGTPFKYIGRMIFYEALLMCGSGYILGSFLGFLMLVYFKVYGLDLSNFSSGLNSYGMAAITYAELHVSYFVLAFVVVFMTSFVSALFPVWRLKRLNPVQAIRFS